MTPLGEKLHDLREQRGVTQKQMAEAVGVSPAYLSALEHGQRGEPSWAVLQRILGYLNVIWDEAEEIQELAALSRPKVSIDTRKLSVQATRTANLLARHIDHLDDDLLKKIENLMMRS